MGPLKFNRGFLCSFLLSLSLSLCQIKRQPLQSFAHAPRGCHFRIPHVDWVIFSFFPQVLLGVSSEAFLSASHSQECLIPDSWESFQWGSVLHMEAFPLVIRWNAVWFRRIVILSSTPCPFSISLMLHILSTHYSAECIRSWGARLRKCLLK